MTTSFGPVTGDVRGPVQFKDGQVTFENGVNFMGGGQFWHVNSARSGGTSGDGKTWANAFITIAEAVAASLAAGGTYDTILVKGTENDAYPATNDYDEAVVVDVTQIGLRIIGMGNGPEGVLWNADADEVVLTVDAKDCYVSGFRFRPDGATTGCAIKLESNASLSKDPAGFIVENCIFRSTGTTALAGILIDSTNDVTIRNNTFTSVATGVLMQATNNSVAYRMKVMNNIFDDKCTNAIIIDGRSCLIKDNDFVGDSFTTLIQTNAVGAAGSYNMVKNHTLLVATAYETNCLGHSTDDWIGNYCDDTGSSVVGYNLDGFANYGQVIGYPQA